MSGIDADRWNQRYRLPAYNTLTRPRKILIENMRFIPRTGRALDIACGLGYSSMYLLGCGLNVYAVDIAIQALKSLRNSDSNIKIFAADLENIFLPKNHFSIITNFYYFNPSFFHSLSDKLVHDGVLFVESLTENILDIKPDIEKQHLLKPGELITFFEQMEILHYFEGWLFEGDGKQKAVAQLIARKL